MKQSSKYYDVLSKELDEQKKNSEKSNASLWSLGLKIGYKDASKHMTVLSELIESRTVAVDNGQGGEVLY